MSAQIAETDFFQRLDQAMTGDCANNVVACVRKVLCDAIRDSSLPIPAACYQTEDDHYARRLLHRSDEHGYSVIAMTWAPGQSTPIHDHSGLWCVEGICAGALEVVQYELMEQDDERFRFESRGCIQACTGSAGSLIPPHEYHTIANPDADNIAISVHVYSGDLDCCSTFAPQADNWYLRETRNLTLD